MFENIFVQLSFILCLCASLGFLLNKFKLPLIPAYLLAGLIVSITGFIPIQNSVLNFLPEIGIAFLLFLIGMELDLHELRLLGRPIMATSLLQTLISVLAGFCLAGWIGYSLTESVFVGLSIAFSSTIVVIKLLLDKHDLSSLYGKLSVGILLVEDLVAVVVLIVISLGSNHQLPQIVLIIAKSVGFLVVTYLLTKFVLERLFSAVAKSLELLFLTALTWCFLYTALAVLAGFSIEIGAFLAGVALASSPYHFQIQGKIKPLRDFFVMLFFVYLGSQVVVADIARQWLLILVLTGYVILIKPIVSMLLLGIFGFRKHTIFQTAINLSQISEFSLIILLLAVQTRGLSSALLSALSLVGVASIVSSSIIIMYSKKLYSMLSKFISFFEHGKSNKYFERELTSELTNHVVVIGAHRLGGPVVRYLHRNQIPFIVLEFNPHIIEQLEQIGINAVYGDISDPDIMNKINLKDAKLIISTATDLTDTEMLLTECKRIKSKAYIAVRALDESQDELLKKLGADFVIVPEMLSGHFLVEHLKSTWL